MKKKMLFLVPFLLIAAAFLLVLPPSPGTIPKEHRLSEKTYIDIDGAQIGLILLSDSTDNPVLLVCGGGPGIPQYLMESFYPSVLPRYFTVCYYDYRGTGLSYDGSIDPGSMTTDLFINDTLFVTDYLKERFGQEKIYIMGHSFGTFIALNMVDRHPENYIAYLAMSQTCDQHRSEILAYNYMRDRYEEMGNRSMTAIVNDNNIFT